MTKKRSPERAATKALKLENKIAAEEADLIDRAESLSGEQEYLKEYLYMYRSLRRLIRKAKTDALSSGSGRAYYALCTLLSQQREVIADIRTMTDMTGQVDQLVQDVLQPYSQAIGQAIIGSFYQLRSLAKETTKDTETKFALKKIEEIIKEITKALQHSHEIAVSNTYSILIGPSGKS